MTATDVTLRNGLSKPLQAAIACDEKLAIEVVSLLDMLALLIFEGKKALAKVRGVVSGGLSPREREGTICHAAVLM